eukprot:630801-Pelagomonas_calceolata.AAC.1
MEKSRTVACSKPQPAPAICTRPASGTTPSAGHAASERVRGPGCKCRTNPGCLSRELSSRISSSCDALLTTPLLEMGVSERARGNRRQSNEMGLARAHSACPISHFRVRHMKLRRGLPSRQSSRSTQHH